MSTGKALTNKELAELSKAMGEFQDVLVEAQAAVTKLLKGPANADLTTAEGKAAWFDLIAGVGQLPEDDVLGVAVSALLALLRLHHQPKLKVAEMFPGLVEDQPT